MDSAGVMEEFDRTGSALASADFNADGYDDLAIGAPGETLSGQSNAGAVIIVYGSKHGLTHVGAVFRFASGVGSGGGSMGDAKFGDALAAGDFDGDGDGDLAIGAPGETVSGQSSAGRVYLLLGDPAGISMSATSFTQADVPGALVESGDEFGGAFAVGYFNDSLVTASSCADLAVGSPGEDSDAGAIFYVPGAPAGFDLANSKWFKQSTLGGTNVGGDRFGHALAAGNLFSTSYEDLVASAPFKTVDGTDGAGIVFLLSGGPTGLVSAGALSYDATMVLGDAPELDANFGFALAVGQFAQASYRSVAIGEPRRDISPTKLETGRVVSTVGDVAGLDLDPGPVRVHRQGFSGTTAEDGDFFGSSVAAGNFNDDDGLGLDDLAVGSIGEDSYNGTTLGQSGMVEVFLGATNGLANAGAKNYTQSKDLSDQEGDDDRFGYALAFGRFDDSGLANLAIGTPGQDDRFDSFSDGTIKGLDPDYLPSLSDVGCVFVLAPWRQVLGLHEWNTFVFNCYDELLLSQRYFDRVRPSSSAKMIVLLMAAERSQLDPADPQYLDLDFDYEVPESVVDLAAPYSKYKPLALVENECMAVRELMYGLAMVSATDAMIALADIMDTDPETLDLPDFINQMNARVLEPDLNMTGTWRNPANIGEHYSTARDMAILARAITQNPLTKEIVGTVEREVLRGGCGGFLIPLLLFNDFLDDVKSGLPQASGIKRGASKRNYAARILSADSLGTTVIAGRFGIRKGVWDARWSAKVLSLGFVDCGVLTIVPDLPRGPWQLVLEDISTEEDSEKGVGGDFIADDGDSIYVESYRRAGDWPVFFGLTIGRHNDAYLELSETASFRIDPFESHQGFMIANRDPVTTVALQVTLSHPPSTTTYMIPAKDHVVLPTYSGPQVSAFTMDVVNLSPDPAHFQIDELGYEFDVVLDDDTTYSVPPTFFSGLLTQNENVNAQGMFMISTGQDTIPGNRIFLIARGPGGTPIGIQDQGPVAGTGPPALRLRAAYPNPFQDVTQIAFDLYRPGKVGWAVYDVSGRRVRRFDGKSLPPGQWTFDWDGRNAKGVRVRAGVYFVRVTLDGRKAASGKIVLVR
jgi:hypothetical protein